MNGKYRHWADGDELTFFSRARAYLGPCTHLPARLQWKLFIGTRSCSSVLLLCWPVDWRYSVVWTMREARACRLSYRHARKRIASKLYRKGMYIKERCLLKYDLPVVTVSVLSKSRVVRDWL